MIGLAAVPLKDPPEGVKKSLAPACRLSTLGLALHRPAVSSLPQAWGASRPLMAPAAMAPRATDMRHAVCQRHVCERARC